MEPLKRALRTSRDPVHRTARFRCVSVALAALLAGPIVLNARTAEPVLNPRSFQHYVEQFNRMTDEPVVNHVPNAEAWSWLRDNVPLFESPDPAIEEIYYYRWWAFRKHLKQTPLGFILTEFLRPVSHATDYNAISSALGHHLNEGRWLHDPRYLNQYISFWLGSGAGAQVQPALHHVRMGLISGSHVRAWWFDPRTGSARSAGVFANAGERRFDPPSEPAAPSDWVLVLDDEAGAFGPPGSPAGAGSDLPSAK